MKAALPSRLLSLTLQSTCLPLPAPPTQGAVLGWSRGPKWMTTKPKLSQSP